MENIYKNLKDFAYLIFIFLGMKTDVVKILFVLMAIDTVFGIIKALRLKKKVSLTVLLWGIVTKLSLLGVPMIIALMAKALTFDFYYFVVAVMNIIVVSEGISIVTNIISIKTKEEVKNEDYITMLLQAIKDGLHKQIMKLISVIKNGKDADNI
jgi:phage-related holin